jgi:hypothetical protein
MTYYLPDSVLTAVEDDGKDRPLGWHLTIDLGGCDASLIDDRVMVAGLSAFPVGDADRPSCRANIPGWGDRLCAQTGVFTTSTAVVDVFGDDTDAGLSVRFRLDQPVGWRGVQRPVRAEATVRCHPATHGVHIDVLAGFCFDQAAVVDFSIDFFAARCGVSTFRARRAPSLTTGFRHYSQEAP